MAARNGRKKGANNHIHQPSVVVKQCEWCGKGVPTVRYHLRICPDCRRTSISAFKRSFSK